MKMEIVNETELKKEVEESIKPQEEQVNALTKQADANVTEIFNLNLDELEEKRKILKSIEEFGMENMKASAHKNNLLKVTVGKLSKNGEDGGEIANSLADLHQEIKDLDPSPLDFTKEGPLGKIFNPIRRYFNRYERADQVIDGILKSLEKGKTTLINDNTTLEIEEDGLRELSKKLSAEIELGALMDAKVCESIEKAKTEGVEEDKLKFVNEEILFPIRQRVMDMQQMVVVNNQGVIAMEVIRRNNKELIRGIERAKSVTVSALNTAVMVASALYNQKIVLNKIEALNDTTNNLITATSGMLKEQGATIQKRSMESTLSPEVLKQSFQEALSALNDIATFKEEALPKMAETVKQFKELADMGEKEIEKLERSKSE